MRFRFCGDLDCPDWVLAEINILARLTSVKMKLLVMQVIKAILGDEIDLKKVEKITSDAKYEPGDVKASIAGIRYIISSAAKHDVDEETLSSELQQLGLPKEHTAALCKTYDGKLSQLQEEFRKQSLRRSGRLENVAWKIEEVKNDKSGEIEKHAVINLQLKSSDAVLEKKSFRIGADKLRIFLHELKTAQGLMKELN
uniref:COMM domain-containing protein 4-like n=1 Tax=Styela clava TaxID=7725 RepID=UPI00193AAA99|nr:COMM domain-containing protein 4-like [Styela clava]